jgi:beta-phosphoglucomutase-like phosphatase (HAD superfamily)
MTIAKCVGNLEGASALQIMQIRAGVKEVIELAKQTGRQLALASTTSEDNIIATLDALSGIVARDDFAFIGNASMVENSKPAPDIYI